MTWGDRLDYIVEDEAAARARAGEAGFWTGAKTVGARRGAGAAERGGLENRCTALRYRGFESLPLRHETWLPSRYNPYGK